MLEGLQQLWVLCLGFLASLFTSGVLGLHHWTWTPPRCFQHLLFSHSHRHSLTSKCCTFKIALFFFFFPDYIVLLHNALLRGKVNVYKDVIVVISPFPRASSGKERMQQAITSLSIRGRGRGAQWPKGGCTLLRFSLRNAFFRARRERGIERARDRVVHETGGSVQT